MPSCFTIDFCTISAKSRDSSILLLSAIARTISGRLCIVWPDAAFSRAATASASGFDGEVQEVGLDAAGLRVAARVGVDREEQIRAFAVGDRGPLLERNEDVGVAGHDHLDAGLLLEQLLQPQRDVEHQLRLVDAVARARRDRGRRGRRR